MKKQAEYRKIADIRYRVQLKNRPGIVVYKVASSNGVDVYDVTLVNGRVSSCTCPALKPCYHMRDVQARESERTADRDAKRTAENNYLLSMEGIGA